MDAKYPVIESADSFEIEGGETGILLCHGFLGTPQSMHELAASLARFGYTISCPRLPGHGTCVEDLERFSYTDWYKRVEEAYHDLKRTCSSVYVIGQSMGGTLALDLASEYQDMDGLVLLNPAIRIPDFEPYRNGTGYVSEGRPDIKRQDVEEITYDKCPVRAYQQLLNYMDAVREKLFRIDVPTLSFQSVEDHVVPPENTDEIMSQIQSEHKEKYVLTDSYHIASMDHEVEVIVEHTVQFIHDTSMNDTTDHTAEEVFK
ncbi:alpha/beta fold hydrolase [Halobacillus fulvus]|nr:alpha/beta fold hydrolase [Halobacillus fulvus]